MERLAEALVGLLGPENVSLDGAELERLAWDALRPHRAFCEYDKLEPRPWAAARPRSSEEVAAVVRLAAEQGMPIVPYGGGTGLMGGAVALRPGIALDMSGLDQILSISRADRTVWTQAGVILETLENELNRQGLILGHDPWSLPIASVGGAISTNGLGYRAAKYGSMGDQVLGLTAVLADGSIVRTRPVSPRSTGIDLNRLLIGGEGCFGIITEAVLRVFPQPEKRLLVVYGFSTFEDGFAAICKMFDIGLRPALLDYGETYSPPLMKRFLREIYPQAEGPGLYLAFEGFKEEVDAQARRAESICVSFGGRDLGRGEARSFWDTRHQAAERYARSRLWRAGERALSWVGGMKLDFVHVAIPASRVLEYRQRCREVLARHRVYPLEYGLWCQPELFSVVMAKMALKDRRRTTAAMAAAVDELLTLAQEMGGSMEYCHGVGIRLAHLMEREHGPAGLEAMRAIKRALDPHNILNPGKLAL
ncbi:MAG: FAD-binding oxidoreductase [Dehalococcoidia bacterium]